MSGGAFEYVMGNVAMASSYTYLDTSQGPSTKPEDKYMDTYTNPENKGTAHQNGKLGDATKETLKIFGSYSDGWYSDPITIPSVNSHWFKRGSYYKDVNVGIFCSSNGLGNSNNDITFRIVLTAEDIEELPIEEFNDPVNCDGCN